MEKRRCLSCGPKPLRDKNPPTCEQSGVLIVSVSGRIDHTRSEEFATGCCSLPPQNRIV